MKLLLTGALEYNEQQINELKSLGFDILYIKDERELIAPNTAAEIQAVVCNGLFLYNDIDKFTDLRLVQLTSAGLDRVPVDYIKEHGIKLFNARGVYSAPMAEFALWGVLSLYKNAKYFYNNQLNHVWQKNRQLRELSQKSVLIIGCGSIGTETAKRFKAFDTNIIGIDKNDVQKECFDKIVTADRLNEYLSTADIAVLTLPLNESTKGMFDKKRFAVMKKDAVFVNISRAALAVQNDLISALQNNQIAGAVLDVIEQEPLSADNPLWDMDNVIITPHNSFVGENNQGRMFEVVKRNLSAFTDYYMIEN